MSKVLHVIASETGASFGAGVTRRVPIAIGTLLTSYGSSNSGGNARWHTPVEMSRLWVKVITNGTTSGSTVALSKTGTAPTLTIPIGAGATGEFEDLTHTDSVVATEDVRALLTVGATGAVVITAIAVQVSAATGTVIKYMNQGVIINSASTTRVWALCGNGDDDVGLGAIANVQSKYRVAGTVRNLVVNVNTNGRSTDTAVSIFVNGVASPVTCLVGALATGVFQDLTHTQAIVDGDLVCWGAVTGTGSGSLIFHNTMFEFTTTADETQYVANVANSGSTVNAGTTWYGAVIGRSSFNTVTEANTQVRANQHQTLSRLTVHVSTNGIVGTTNVRLRVDDGTGPVDSALVAPIGGGLTGWFEDISNSVEVDAADLINYSVVAGASGTSLRLDVTGVKSVIADAVAPPTAPSNLTLVAANASIIDVGWDDNSADETGFKVQRAPDVVLTGLVDITTGSDLVHGVGTAFSSECGAGTRLRFEDDDETYEVESVTDDDDLVLTTVIIGAGGNGLEFGRPGTFTTVQTVAADVESYSNSGLTEVTPYWFQVRATKSGVDSTPTPAEFVFTKANPEVAIDDPPDGSVVSTGVRIVLSGTVVDPDGYEFLDSDIQWSSSLDGVLGNGPTITALLSNGIHLITLHAVDEDGDQNTASITITVGTPSTATGRREPVDTERAYGVAADFRCTIWNSAEQPFTGALAAGDIKVSKDGAAISAPASNIATLPTLDANGRTWHVSLSSGELTAKEIDVFYVAAGASPVPFLHIRTYGNSSAHFTEGVLTVGADGNAAADVKKVNAVTVIGDGSNVPWGPG